MTTFPWTGGVVRRFEVLPSRPGAPLGGAAGGHSEGVLDYGDLGSNRLVDDGDNGEQTTRYATAYCATQEAMIRSRNVVTYGDGELLVKPA